MGSGEYFCPVTNIGLYGMVARTKTEHSALGLSTEHWPALRLSTHHWPDHRYRYTKAFYLHYAAVML